MAAAWGGVIFNRFDFMTMRRCFWLLVPLVMMVFGHGVVLGEAPRKWANEVRLLCVDAAAGADKLVLLEKGEDGWVARWRLSVSSAFLTDGLGFGSRELALGIDPAPPVSNGFNGPPVAVGEAMEVVPFHEFRIPASGTGTAVLIADASGGVKRPYRVVVLDSSAGRFGAGSILVQNFTTAKVAGKFGGKAVQVGPGEAEVVVPGVDQEPGMAQITLARAEGEGWSVFCDTRWPAKAEYRRFLLLIPRQDGSIHPFVMPEHPPFR
jgi:hypothetical protein